MSHRPAAQPFVLKPSGGSVWKRAALSIAAPVLERALGLSTLNRLYVASEAGLSDDFADRALSTLGIRWTAQGAVGDIPSQGPLVVIANHPFGTADGLVLLALLRRVRPDFRLLGNYLLRRLPELAPYVFPVDPFGGPGARTTNRHALRRAIDWTRRGGALIVFPAGEVSAQPAAEGALVDGAWKAGVLRILKASQAPTLPVYFEGRNSRAFELAGRMHPALQTLLLPRELLRRRGQAVTLSVGTAIPHARLEALSSSTAALDYLRARTYGLRRETAGRDQRRSRSQRPVPPAPDRIDDIAREIAALHTDRTLISNRTFAVMYASASEIPAALREIGRLRELAFRAAGEGSGNPIDLDEFDGHYWHLFLWDHTRGVIVGAYRLGPTDAIIPALGLAGLYTRTLFTYGRDFVEALGPALELGRSFVRIEYQKDFGPLLLLWQGICRFVAKHTQYRRLFGPVSISTAYSGASRDALVDLLASPSFESPLGRLVRARRRYHYRTRTPRPVVSVDPAEVQGLIGDVEADGRGMPVLLRQYLKLNARIAAVSVDPEFSNVVDALTIVDLADVERPLLDRFFGRAGADAIQGSNQTAA